MWMIAFEAPEIRWGWRPKWNWSDHNHKYQKVTKKKRNIVWVLISQLYLGALSRSYPGSTLVLSLASLRNRRATLRILCYLYWFWHVLTLTRPLAILACRWRRVRARVSWVQRNRIAAVQLRSCEQALARVSHWQAGLLKKGGKQRELRTWSPA